ncbi:hypothetical protein RJT34_33061 [Clitoria ternatea]|uniref:Uncharacterized protein n=1 Tax=Clitoria ternatea TaxID=43366 RepID=A0AAN9EZF4_CLITE
MDRVPVPHPFMLNQDEFAVFHSIDRELYKILAINLSREPAESMQVLAMWLWLEKVGFHNVVRKVLALPNILINEVADETVTCMNCINQGTLTPENNDIPLLQSLMQDKEISIQFLLENRARAFQGVAKMVQEVCVRACGDIMQQAITRNANERRIMLEAQRVGQSSTDNNFNVNSNNNNNNNRFWFGSIGPNSSLRLGTVGASSSSSPIAIPADDRTLFVTFSKGYRVEEWEVREFFTMAYGDCVEALFMQEVVPEEQPLFARIVFRCVSTIDMILRGATKAKFTINGKHVWARKFVPKRTNMTRPNFPGESSGFGH